jgi:hypothetical protein
MISGGVTRPMAMVGAWSTPRQDIMQDGNFRTQEPGTALTNWDKNHAT